MSATGGEEASTIASEMIVASAQHKWAASQHGLTAKSISYPLTAA